MNNGFTGLVNPLEPTKDKTGIKKDDTYRRLEERLDKWMELHKNVPVVYAILKNVKEVVFNGAKMY